MKVLLCLTLLLGAISPGLVQKARQKSALESMVETERAFARMSEEQGIRPSFMAFIADEGILFRPTAVKGKQWMTAHPLPPSDKRPLLSWYPAIAGMARTGDMGYTTGPWEYRADVHDAKPVAWGNFLTVWKKQADGEWKFAIDLGISNPQPAQAVAQWKLPKHYKAPRFPKGFWTFNADALLARDRQFSRASAMRGALDAFDAYAAEDVRVFRNDKQPFVGKALAATALPEASVIWTWEPAFADVSESDDLGYSYGTYQLAKKDTKLKARERCETGNYYRIWEKRGNTWKVIADLLDPQTPEQKKH